MRVEPLAGEGRTPLRRDGSVGRDASFHSVTAQPPSNASREQWVFGATASFREPGRQRGLALQGEWHRTLFAALALAAYVTASSQNHTAAVEADELGNAQAGLYGEHQHGAVATAFPPRPVGCLDERGGLSSGEESHDPLLESFGWDGQHSLDDGSVFRMPESAVVKQGANGGQAQIAGSRAVPAVVFEVVEEGGNDIFVEVVPLQRGRLFPSGGLHEAEKQPEGVS